MERDLTTLEVAQSLYRLGAAIANTISGKDSPISWDHASVSEQATAIRIAQVGPTAMEHCEGQRFHDVATNLYLATLDRSERDYGLQQWSDKLPESYKLMWEAFARHLHVLMDCDDDATPDASEEMMLNWFRKRIETLTAENVCLR